MDWTRLCWLVPVLPLTAFVLTVFVTRHFKNSKISALVSIFFNTAAFGVAAIVFAELIGLVRSGNYHGPIETALSWIHLPGSGIFPGLHLEVGTMADPLSAILAVMVTLVSTLIFIYSIGYMSGDPAFSMFFSFMSLFACAMLTLVFANNFILMFMAWELVGLCSYLLIGFWYAKPSAARAAVKAFVVTRTGDLGFLIGIIALYHAAGTLNFGRLSVWVSAHPLTGWMSWGIPLLIFCGAAGKSAQFPLHVWLPDAMEGPTPVSALIHAATMVAAGVYLVARSYFLFAASPTALLIVAWIGGFTAFLAATMALVQWDSKRVLAYSTISQLGYMMLALGLGPIGFVAAVFHLLTHAFFKALLFLGAGSVARPFHKESNPFDMRHYGGLSEKMPATYVTFLAATLAISGAPLFSGFFSKDAILGAAFHSGIPTHFALWALAVFTAYLTGAYMFRLLFITFRGSKKPAPGAHESPGVMVWPLAVLAVFAAGAGWMGLPGHNWIGGFFGPYRAFYGIPAEHTTDWFGMTLGTGVFVLGYLTARVLYRGEMRFAFLLENPLVKPFHSLFSAKWYMDDFWNAVLRFFGYRLAAAASWFDTNIVDGPVRGIGLAGAWCGRSIRAVQTGAVQQYAFVIAVSLVIASVLLGLGGHWWIQRF